MRADKGRPKFDTTRSVNAAGFLLPSHMTIVRSLCMVLSDVRESQSKHRQGRIHWIIIARSITRNQSGSSGIEPFCREILGFLGHDLSARTHFTGHITTGTSIVDGNEREVFLSGRMERFDCQTDEFGTGEISSWPPVRSIQHPHGGSYLGKKKRSRHSPQVPASSFASASSILFETVIVQAYETSLLPLLNLFH